MDELQFCVLVEGLKTYLTQNINQSYIEINRFTFINIHI